MVRIAGRTYDCPINYNAGPESADIEIVVPKSASLSDEDVAAIKNATEMEEVDYNFGSEVGVIGTYALVGWKLVENLYNGTRFRWQTYRTTDIEKIKQDNEDLTQALLELAEIVGGNNG